MIFATYQDFRVSVQTLIDGDDLLSDIAPETLDLIIGMGEVRVYRDLRASTMETALAQVVTANAAPLPANCLALGIVWFDPTKPLEIVSESDLRSRMPAIGGGTPRKCAQAGESIIFSPAAANSATLAGRYYARPADLKTALNSTLARYPELFLYASLCESAPFLGEQERLGIWENTYAKLMSSAMSQENNRVFSGSQLRQVLR